MPVKWSRLLQFYSEDQQPPIFAGIASEVLSRYKIRLESDNTGYFLRRLKQADPEDRYKLLFDHISEQVIKTLGLTTSVLLNADQGLTDLGMDSLMAVEISNRLKRSLGVKLSSTIAFEHPTLKDLTGYLAADTLGLEKIDVLRDKVDSKEKIRSTARKEVEKLSEEDAAKTLIHELEKTGY
jgi:acyl carrier protein